MWIHKHNVQPRISELDSLNCNSILDFLNKLLALSNCSIHKIVLKKSTKIPLNRETTSET